jgi:hypothetical protein
MPWLVLAFIIPIIVVWFNGSTYAFSFSLFIVGIVLYFLNIALIRYFIKKEVPYRLEDSSWEMTAGTGLVPKWVSALGLVGIGLIPSALIIALLLWLVF